VIASTRARNWPIPTARGINLSVDVDDVDEIHAAVVQAGHELFLPLEERWYDRTDDAVGVRQFAVQDPDGYLLRLTQGIGTRPLPLTRKPGSWPKAIHREIAG
jgi:hypothetical protein